MKSKIIDISLSLQKGMPVWPKSFGIQLAKSQGFEKGDSVNVSKLETDVHFGTHIENSLHFIKEGSPVEEITLEKLVGPVTVVELPKIRAITADILEKLDLSQGITRLLFRTDNSELWRKKEKKFRKDYVGLTADAALWLVKHGIELVGNDYLSIARYKESVEVHRILLKNKIIILEGLDLSQVSPGIYQLICLPLKLIGTEAAPARAVLLSL